MIAAGEITPILPSTSEKMPDNITKYFLDHLLNYMVSEVSPSWVSLLFDFVCGVISSECCPDGFFCGVFVDERNCRVTVSNLSKRLFFFEGENRHACMHLRDVHTHRSTGSHTHISLLAHLGPVWYTGVTVGWLTSVRKTVNARTRVQFLPVVVG